MNDMLADSDRGTRERGSSRDSVMFSTSLLQKRFLKAGKKVFLGEIRYSPLVFAAKNDSDQEAEAGIHVTPSPCKEHEYTSAITIVSVPLYTLSV